MDASLHDPHDFLMPDGWPVLEIAVDDNDGTWPQSPQLVDVSHGCRRKIKGVELRARVGDRERGADKHVDVVHRLLATCIARRPRRYDTSLSTKPSSPGTMTRTTGILNSSRVRSTTTT